MPTLPSEKNQPVTLDALGNGAEFQPKASLEKISMLAGVPNSNAIEFAEVNVFTVDKTTVERVGKAPNLEPWKVSSASYSAAFKRALAAGKALILRGEPLTATSRIGSAILDAAKPAFAKAAKGAMKRAVKYAPPIAIAAAGLTVYDSYSLYSDGEPAQAAYRATHLIPHPGLDVVKGAFDVGWAWGTGYNAAVHAVLDEYAKWGEKQPFATSSIAP